jgi:RNA polymerase sigma factor (TIGR02999 family)
VATDLQAEVTCLLEQLQAGNEDARNQVVALVYEELRRIAAGLMREEPPDHTLEPTALVNEALLRLLRGDVLRKAPDRRYLFAAAVRSMRQILVEHARRRATDKRGAGQQRVPLDAVLDHCREQNLDVAALHDALDRLAALDARQSQVVTLRFFGRFTVPEVAELLGVSVTTVEEDFRVARNWLHRQLAETT